MSNPSRHNCLPHFEGSGQADIDASSTLSDLNAAELIAQMLDVMQALDMPSPEHDNNGTADKGMQKGMARTHCKVPTARYLAD